MAVWVIGMAALCSTEATAACLYPVNIDASVVTTWRQGAGMVDAVGSADVTNLAGEVCSFASVSATATVRKNGLPFSSTTASNGTTGSVLVTASAPAVYPNCYDSAIEAQSDFVVSKSYGSGEQVCLQGPPREVHGYNICPLIVDMDGNGILTSGAANPVSFFDTNGDGIREPSGWTAADSDDAFPWLDLNGNNVADPGELFGSKMPLPSGGVAKNGFEALGVFDEEEYGGNGDWVIDRRDAVWHSIRLWTDRNHDGVSQHQEIDTLGAAKIVELALAATRAHQWDEHGNVLMYEGQYVKRVVDEAGPAELAHRRLDDISFVELSQ